MLRHMLFCVDCFWFVFNCPQNPFEKALKKNKTEKKLEIKKRESLPGSGPKPSAPLHPRPSNSAPQARPDARPPPFLLGTDIPDPPVSVFPLPFLLLQRVRHGLHTRAGLESASSVIWCRDSQIKPL